MKSVVLTKEEVKEFNQITGICANYVLITQLNKYYYATIIDNFVTVRIGKDLAHKFI